MPEAAWSTQTMVTALTRRREIQRDNSRIGFNNVMVPDSTLNKAFFVGESSGMATIEAFNLTEFSSIGSISFTGDSDFPTRIIRWGNNGLAFITSQGSVYLVGGNFVH